MSMEERCPTRLLPDTPADTDSFGSHERVAHSIAEVVQTESGGKAIGLEGGWGSGKSTIVKLISWKLSQHKESFHKIAVFDMWSHQGDPLRRTFLVLQRQFREGCGVMPAWRRGAWHGSVWPVRYCPAYPQATAATRLARTVPGAAFPAPPGRPAAS